LRTTSQQDSSLPRNQSLQQPPQAQQEPLLGDRLNLSTTANLRNSPIVDSQLSTSSVPGGVVITESDRNDTNLQRLVSQLTGRVIIPPAQILPVMAENDMVNAR